MGHLVTKRFRNANYGDSYTIDFVQDGEIIRLYCLEHPHNPRSTNVSECHLYSSNEICVAKGKEPRTLDRAVAISQLFVNGYSQYVRTGSFPNKACKVNV